jgi:hypothetical protein
MLCLYFDFAFICGQTRICSNWSIPMILFGQRRTPAALVEGMRVVSTDFGVAGFRGRD